MMQSRTVRIIAVVIAALVGITLVATAIPADAHSERRGTHAGPARISLPDGFQPEGIAIGRHHVGYVGSRVTGDIYRFDLRTGQGRVFSKGPGTPSLGLKLDGHGRLFVAGGSGGDLRVLDTRSGRVLASYQLTTATSFVNDLVLTDHAAYVTDSAQAQLYRVPLGRHGRLPSASAVTTVPLTGAWQQLAGNNANGITTTPDGRALLVINSASGVLYRVTRSGVATAVDAGGVSLANGDGLLREGRRLYVVQNRLNKIAVLRLGRDARSARLTQTITSPLFDVPSTVARSGKYLYLPNARFTTTATPTTPYDVTRVKG